MPDYDSLGRKVIIIRPGCFNPYLHRVEDIEKANFMVSDVMGLEDEQVFITGIVIIIDFDGYSFGHLTRRPLAITMKWLKFLQVRKQSDSVALPSDLQLLFYYSFFSRMLSQLVRRRCISSEHRLPSIGASV